ncbi:hypothetical protein [Nitrosomonas communis]|uniref:Uncharacterized protein n=1 Tax=Nitrosomonas communis TaxID=44574 RepID=A0A1I4LTH0_9PROT|nr:hypothetical protein [Nitrosomonas communis]SFL94310.1 hypothetical protein SAMN05421863_100788 [Nitrosomonas communis]
MIKSYKFTGKVQDIALIVAGIHGSELSGVEVARWLLVKLQKLTGNEKKKGKAGWKPYFTTVIVPEVYPKSVGLARQCLDKKAKSKNEELKKQCETSRGGREIAWQFKGDKNYYSIPPNRQFPPPGQPFSDLSQKSGPVDPDGNPIKKGANNEDLPEKVPLLAETKALLELVEKLKPKRIASIHAMFVREEPGFGNKPDYGIDAPGIFVDPRYEYDKRVGQRNPLEPLTSNDEPLIFGTDNCKFNFALEPASPVIGLIKQMYEWLSKNYFWWKMLPDNPGEVVRLIEFLKKTYAIDWISQAAVQKIAGTETIRLSSGNNFLTLTLNGNKIDLTMSDGTTDEFWAPLELGIRKMYPVTEAEITEIKEVAKSFRKEKKRHTESLAKAQAVAKKLELVGFQPVAKDTISALTSEGRKDDRLALEIAKKIDKGLVPGNHLKGSSSGGVNPPVIRYAASAAPPDGFSFGDWGPVSIKKEKDPGNRDGAPVITVEVYGRDDSGAFQSDGKQLYGEDCKSLDKKTKPKILKKSKRCKQLQSYADALIDIFLAKPKIS